MKNQEELIWQYLDGQLDASERARVEQALETDPSFRELMLQSKVLHRELNEIETELPSMRFTQNVMDRLPAVKELATGPLVSLTWLRSFYGSLLTLTTVLVGGSVAFMPVNTAAENPQVDRLVDKLYALLSHLPDHFLIMAGTVTICLLLLLYLDRWLQRKFRTS